VYIAAIIYNQIIKRALFSFLFIFYTVGNQNLTTFINTYVFIGVGSSAALVLLLSLAVFLCTCTYCYFKKKRIINESADKPQHSIAPIYEDIPPKTTNCQETNIDFKTNVAYSTVEIRSYINLTQ
jgi:hypothetical protein